MDGPMSDPIAIRTNESGITKELINLSAVLKLFYLYFLMIVYSSISSSHWLSCWYKW